MIGVVRVIQTLGWMFLKNKKDWQSWRDTSRIMPSLLSSDISVFNLI